MSASNITRAALLSLAERLIRESGLVGWRVRVGSAKTNLGSCRYRDKTIMLSHPLAALNPLAELEDTIRHEIAHAIAGPGAGHGPEWKRVAVEVGARPEREARGLASPPKQAVGTCPNCDRVVRKHRRVRVACGPCCTKYNGGKFTSDYLIVWG